MVLHYLLLLLTFLPVSLMVLPTGYQRGNEVDSKAVAASLSLTDAHPSDTSIASVTIDSPRDSEGMRSPDALHSPTTGQIKRVSVSMQKRRREGRGGGEGRGGEGR